MFKKNFSVIQKYAKNYWVLIFQSEFLCLKLSLPLQSRARIGEKIEKKNDCYAGYYSWAKIIGGIYEKKKN